MKYKIVRVLWTDSYMIGDRWKYLKDFPEIVDNECMSIGFLVKETDKHFVVSPHITSTEENDEDYHTFTGTMVIPKCSVLKFEYLEEEKK